MQPGTNSSQQPRTVPLPGNFVPCIAVAPGIVIYGFLGVHQHVLLARASRVQVANRLHHALPLWLKLDGLLRIGLVVDARE